MTIGFPTREDSFNAGTWEVIPEDGWQRPPVQIDALAVALLILILFLAFQLLTDGDRKEVANIDRTESATSSEEATLESAETSQNSEFGEAKPETVAPLPPIVDPSYITYPYDEYWVTQGVHGQSYGHMAIDLAAGKGTPIKSPIQGSVTANYVDIYGNTTIVIENERYTVTMLHGDYTAVAGQVIGLSEILGSESNHGYTTDMNGNSCQGRDCGYHTHLNVYDKSLGQNISPLAILAP